MNICVVSPNKSSYSETFVRAHIERLPADVTHLYGDFFRCTYTLIGLWCRLVMLR